uniref:GOLD domain-containing protein n=1 Tax=Caenorhabditis japonica TaxID=281687 RepID=A0A8R1IDQ1_CAEJA
MLKFVIFTSILAISASAIELTFELPDNANQCFYEDLKKDVDSVFEFQVVTGGHYDVDLIIEDPNGKVLYKDTKKQYDSINFKAELDGTYKACFSNEFSTFSHKIVYMDWQFGDRNALHAAVTQGAHAMSQLENYAVSIGDKLRT